MAVLHARGADLGDGMDEGLERLVGQGLVAAQVLHEQRSIDADVEVEQAGTIAALADVRRALVREPIVEIVDRAEVVVFDCALVHSDGVGDLDGCLHVEGRAVCQHAPEHGDIGSLARGTQQAQLFRGRSGISAGAALCKLFDRLDLFRAEVRELFDLQILVLVRLFVRLQLAELADDLPSPFAGVLVGYASRDQHRMRVLAHVLGAGTDMARQRGLENVGRPPCAFLTLRGDPQPQCIAHQGGLGAAGVVAVEVGGGIAGEDVQLNEAGHGVLSLSGNREGIGNQSALRAGQS